MRLCHSDHCIDHGADFCTFRGITEQPVAASNGKWADCIFTEVVGKTAFSILKIGHKLFFVILGIVHRLLKMGSFFRSLLWSQLKNAYSTGFSFSSRYAFLCSYVCFLAVEYLSWSNSLFMYWTP